MGQTCCNFSSKDPNAILVNGASITKMNGTAKVSVSELTPQLKEAMSFARQHEKKLVKIQAVVRGYLVRRHLIPKKPARRSSRK
jgi:IQ calmodulin-binding motif